MASIIVVSGAQRGDYYPLGKRTNVIGRAEANPIQVLGQRISRKHLQVYFDQDKQLYNALDMKSKYGVFINGSKIHKETALAEGDRICIGDVTLFFTLKDFPNRESALSHFKKAGERIHTTREQ